MKITVAAILFLACSTLAFGQAPTPPPQAGQGESESHLIPDRTPHPTARFGELVIMVTGLSLAPNSLQPDQSELTVAVAAANAGTGRTAICASIGATLETTYNLSYGNSGAGNAPETQQMLPGEVHSGSYVFDIKTGVKPLALALKIASPDIRCGPAHSDGSIPRQVRLDIHDVPITIPPKPKSSESAPGEIQQAGANGYSTPTCLYCPAPKFSAEALNAKYQGTVVLSVVISVDGKATDVRVVKSLGLGLDENAVAAVRDWRFKPATGADGQPAAVRTDISVVFHLN